jgi:chorismate lyase
VLNAHWRSLTAIEGRAPGPLLSWLAEPGLLTARVRALCGDDMRFRLLAPLRPAALPGVLQARLAVADGVCLLREIEFRCGGSRVVFAQTVLPQSTVTQYPWLRDLGDAPLGETLRLADAPLEREPLEYAELPPTDPLAAAARDGPGNAAEMPLWARRAVYRLGTAPILVQEVFLPALLEVQRRH